MKGIHYRMFALAALIAVLASMLHPLSGRVGPLGSQPVAAANLSWENLATLPSATGNVVPAAPSVMSKIVVSPNYANDRTVFGINRTALPVGGIFTAATNAVWKSVDGGNTWTSLAIGTGLAATATVVDIAISPNYATDMTVAVALDDPAAGVNAMSVWRANDGGTTWSQLPGLPALATLQLTGIDVGIDINGAAVYAVSLVDTAAATFPVAAATVAPVLLFGVNGFLGWANYGTVGSTPAQDASAVKFSPNFQSDRAVVFVSSTVAATTFHHLVVTATAPGAPGVYDSLGGPTPVSAAITGFGDGATAIVRSHIALPVDFNAVATGRRTGFVGTNSGTAGNDNVFRATAASATAATNMGLTFGNIEGVSVSGSIASGAGTLAVGTGGANAGGLVATNAGAFSGTIPGWVQNTVVQGDTGLGAGAPPGLLTYAALTPNFSTSNRILAATYVAGMLDAGFSISDDGGVNFRQVSNLGVAANVTAGGATWRVYSFSTNFTNDNTIFAFSTDGAGGYDSLWRSTSGGSSWARVYAFLSTANTITITYSPSYATDRTLYFRDSTGNRFYASTNGGTTWNLSTVLPVSTWGTLAMLDATTMLAGLANGNIYKAVYNPTALTWTWNATPYSTFSPPPAAVAAPVNITRRGTTNDIVAAIGGASGEVYLSNDLGVTFNRLGTGAANNVVGAAPVASFSPAYTTDNYIYAGTAAAVAGTNSVARWKVGTSTVWEGVCGIPANTGDTLACGLNAGLMIQYDANFAYWIAGAGYVAGPGAAAAGGLWVTTNLGGVNTTVTWSQVRPTTGGVDLAGGAVPALAGAASTTTYLAVRTLPNNAGRAWFLRDAAQGPDTIVTLTDTVSNLSVGTPVPTSPANGSFGVGSADPANTALIQGGSIIASWNPVAGATSYRVQLSSDPNFNPANTCLVTLAAGAPPASSTNFGTAAGVACAVPGLAEVATVNGQGRVAGATYYWAVRVQTPTTSPWSATQSFITSLVAPATVGAPVPVQPNVAVGGQDRSITNQVPTTGTLFVWTQVSNATFYEFQVSEDATFLDASMLVINRTGANSLLNQLAYVSTVTLKPGTNYFWRVRGVTATTVGAWSPATAFTTASTGGSVDIATATASISGAYDIIWVFDNPTQTWKSYTPGAPAFAQTLATLTPGTPVWIKANKATVWTRGSGSVNLVQGWNLVVAP